MIFDTERKQGMFFITYIWWYRADNMYCYLFNKVNGVMAQERQGSKISRLIQKTSNYAPEIIVAVILCMSIFIFILILIH